MAKSDICGPYVDRSLLKVIAVHSALSKMDVNSVTLQLHTGGLKIRRGRHRCV